MIVQVDTSVLLRRLFGEPKPLREWSHIEQAYASRLVPIEIGRVIDRYRLQGILDDADVDTLHRQARLVLRAMDIVALTEPILERAAGALPTIAGTLDAMHLATALELRRSVAPSLMLATHDAQLARAARASGLEVIGM